VDSEQIDYEALYKQVSKELEDYKLNTWIRSQVKPIFLVAWERVRERLVDMTIPEWVCVFVLLSIGIHYHQWLLLMKKANHV
jgi:hypothetical protein